MSESSKSQHSQPNTRSPDNEEENAEIRSLLSNIDESLNKSAEVMHEAGRGGLPVLDIDMLTPALVAPGVGGNVTSVSVSRFVTGSVSVYVFVLFCFCCFRFWFCYLNCFITPTPTR